MVKILKLRVIRNGMIKIKTKQKTTKVRKPTFAKKSFGQNFLVDQNYIDKIISALNPHASETVVEIGAGRGALTEKLIEKAGKVFAIELDRDLIPFIEEKFKDRENFELVEANALKINYSKFHIPNSKVKLVANLPYYISTAILQKLIEQRGVFSEMVLMFQREVVQRITARIGNSERGFLTILTEAYLSAERLFDVPPNAFLPTPKVWSSVVRLKPRENQIANEKLFREVVSAGFMQKRKTIFNNLKNFSPQLDMKKILENARIDANRRAESLTVDEWKCLSDLLATNLHQQI